MRQFTNNKPKHLRTNKNVQNKQVNQLEFQLEESFNDEPEAIQSNSPSMFKRNKDGDNNPQSRVMKFEYHNAKDLRVNLFNGKPSLGLTKSEMLVTPKERDEIPIAFKRSRTDEPPDSNKICCQQSEILQLKRENHKLKREIEKLQVNYQQETEYIK